MNSRPVVLVLLLCVGSLGAAFGCGSSVPDSRNSGRITLTWVAPTSNEDGTELEDLAGYRVYWGRSPDGPYPFTAEVTDPAQTSYAVEGLEDGEWYFAVAAVSHAGEESRLSSEVRVRIQNGERVADDSEPESG